MEIKTIVEDTKNFIMNLSVSGKKIGIALLLLVFVITGVYLFMDDGMTVLLIDDVPVALVEGEGQVEKAINLAKQEITKQKEITISGHNSKLTYDRDTVNKDDKPLSVEELSIILQDKLDWQIDCWIINVDKKPVLYMASEEDAQCALEEIQKYYLPEGEGEKTTIESVEIKEKIEFIEGKGSLNNIKDKKSAVEIIAKGFEEIVKYEVQQGDSLWTIAHANNMTVSRLEEINPQLEGIMLKPGQQLNLVEEKPLLNVMLTLACTKEEEVPYKTIYENDSSLWRGQQRTKQDGVKGSREVAYRITKVNDTELSKETIWEKIIEKPVDKIVIRGTKTMMASRGDGGSGELGWPTRNSITSYYGRRHGGFHTGIDIAGKTGTAVHAAEKGVVIQAGWRGGYGNCIDIDHGNGRSTRYAHLNKIGVSVGQKVNRGDVIGQVGSTGNSTGPHLHFEVRINGAHKNPLRYLER